MTKPIALDALLASIAAPLLRVDNAILYVVTATAERVHLHVGGAYAGCPGNSFVERSLLAPLVLEVYPRATLNVTSGHLVPTGAKRLEAGAQP